MAGLENGSDEGRDVVTALRLMRLALPLLDCAGSDLAAARLQHAIDGLDPDDAPAPDR